MRPTRSQRKHTKSIPQVALNWLLHRPTVSNIVIGARNEEQLKHNLGAAGWNLNPDQIARLDAASAVQKVYPLLASDFLSRTQSVAGAPLVSATARTFI